MRNEYDLQKDVIAYLNKAKIWHFRTQMGSTSGYPDILACVHGYFVGIELKREDGNGKATGQQIKMQCDLSAAGGHCYFVASLAELKDALATIESIYWEGKIK